MLKITLATAKYKFIESFRDDTTSFIFLNLGWKDLSRQTCPLRINLASVQIKRLPVLSVFLFLPEGNHILSVVNVPSVKKKNSKFSGFYTLFAIGNDSS